MSRKIDLYKTDPEFMERHNAFALQEVVNEPGQQLDETTRYLAILASLLGSQALDEYKYILPLALKDALKPVMVKEIVYQAVDYLGIGRVYPFLVATNEIMEEEGIVLPLEGQATTTMDDRLEKGEQAQIDIFGPRMKDFWKGGHINRWLAANCFGDYYTRKGLDLKQREMITFCFLAALGGCEPQLTSHAAGNMNLGNDKAFLIKVTSQCLPYIGYPRSLNAITCIHKAAENNGQ
jgi:4-carboxymuconolactone decarboxylase